jgi:chemotaxis protein CheD
MSDTTISVGISEYKVSKDPADILTTYSLGSCLGLVIYDPVNQIGGLIHCMLPSSQTDLAKAEVKPAMFVDTGVPLLFQSAYKLGANRDKLIIKAAGCGDMIEINPVFQIGQRNYTMLKKLLWKNRLMITTEAVGGAIPRTLSLRMSDGLVLIKSRGKVVEL